MAETVFTSSGGSGVSPGQRTRPHLLHLRVQGPQLEKASLGQRRPTNTGAAAEPWHSQVNKCVCLKIS